VHVDATNMSWENRDYASDDPMRRLGKPGGDWGGLRPSFDNPLTWALPVGRYFGIAVRLHLVFLLFIVIYVLRAAVGGGLGMGLTLILLTALFGIVLLHEFGHCFACRWVGGDADEILMWPLGGLAFTRPPQHWRAHLITTAGGPAVNVALALVLMPMTWALTGIWWGVAAPNPFVIDIGLKETVFDGSWLLTTLYLVNWANLLLLLFNVLVPMFPLDGGRMLQALLWRRIGYARSMHLTVRAGFFGAVALLILGFVSGAMMLAMIAVFGGITCWVTLKQLQYTQTEMGLEGGEYAESLWGTGSGEEPRPRRPSWRQRRASRRAEQDNARTEQEAAAVDDILRKIANTGMESLTPGEQRRLKQATRRTRGQN
jgi:Zn-dependent protease